MYTTRRTYIGLDETKYYCFFFFINALWCVAFVAVTRAGTKRSVCRKKNRWIFFHTISYENQTRTSRLVNAWDVSSANSSWRKRLVVVDVVLRGAKNEFDKKRREYDFDDFKTGPRRIRYAAPKTDVVFRVRCSKMNYAAKSRLSKTLLFFFF